MNARPASGPDGHQLTQPVNGHLDYVSQLSRQLGVNDPVESYLTPVVGRWSDLHAEAGRWRTAATTATQVTTTLGAPLGGLDAAWQGPAADSFLEYMQDVGLAGNDLADAMTAMADALDKTADGLRQIVTEMLGVLSDTAEQASDAMSVPVGGEDRARQFLSEVDQPTSQLYESVRDVLTAFVKMCDGAQGGQTMTLAHSMPAQNWTPPATTTPPPGQPGQLGQSSQPAWPGQPGQPGQPAQPAAPAAAGGAGSPSTVAAAAGGGAGQHAAAAVGTAHLGGGGSPMPDTASAAAAQHQGTPTVSGVSAPDSSSAAAGGAPAGPAAEGGAAGGEGQGGAMMGGMGGMRGGGGQGGGDTEHKSKIRLNADARDLFGKVDKTAPPVIGEE
ncbi:MAG TPA: WXG100 family type VII secretion target [Pseudonocardiaceae bacterium]|jgi:uncharacterized protein YukE